MSYYSSSTVSSDNCSIELLQIPNLLSNISKILCELINKNGKGKYSKKNHFVQKQFQQFLLLNIFKDLKNIQILKIQL